MTGPRHEHARAFLADVLVARGYPAAADMIIDPKEETVLPAIGCDLAIAAVEKAILHFEISRCLVPENEPRHSASIGDMTLREIQTCLPWSIRYSQDFRLNPQPHKDFAHALTHIHKAGGALAAFVDDMDHRKETADQGGLRERYGKYVADLVICALRMANTFPGGVLDLQRAVEDRLETKNDIKLPRRGGDSE